ncbi:MAG: hypothetical protein MJE66_11090 [Proteobacteria bacterium]|nr:hypothetical protein [Pseudomonadota bacterium]
MRGASPLYGPAHLVPRVAALVAEWRQRGWRVAVYGAGEHTAYLMKATALPDARLVGLVDADPRLVGEELWGLPVRAPDALAALRPDVVLISSQRHQDELAARVRALPSPPRLALLYPAADAPLASAERPVPPLGVAG